MMMGAKGILTLVSCYDSDLCKDNFYKELLIHMMYKRNTLLLCLIYKKSLNAYKMIKFLDHMNIK